MIKRMAVLLAICATASAVQAKTIHVASDGSGDFKTVQEALAAVPDNATEETTIEIKPGTYQGAFVIGKTKKHVTMRGEDAKTTILTWGRNVHDPHPEGADGFNPGMQVLADDFRAEKLTIENTSGDHGQALALRVDGDRDAFKECRLLGWQDTLMINNGRDYFENCYIAGRVDFIYGSATAWFEKCEIHSRNGGHVTAASTPEDHPFGFVFNECHLTGDKVGWDPATTNPATTQKAGAYRPADLGRPWRAYASVTYLKCKMDDHIRPDGWNNWGKKDNEKTARYAEYNTTGNGAAPDKRAAWAKQLSKEDAEKITKAAVLGDWKPE